MKSRQHCLLLERRKRMSLVSRSKLAPTELLVKENYLIVGDRYVRNLCVTALPREYYLGMLSFYASDPKVKLYMHTKRLEMEISTLLRKEYNDRLIEYNKTTDPSVRTRMADELSSLNTYIEECVRNNDLTHNLLLVYSVSADDLQELNDRTKNLKAELQVAGFKVSVLPLMQEKMLRMATPIFQDSGLDSVIEDNYGVPLSSQGIAGMYPYVFETLKDRGGFLLGRERSNSGAILFNPFLYQDDEEQAVPQQRVNGNMVVMGTAGSGKTTTMNLLIRSFIRNRQRIVWIDPENKNYPLTKKYGGTFVNWGTKDTLINIFDLKPISCEESENINMWDTELAIYNAIEDIKTILTMLYPSISEDTLTRVGPIAIKTYERKGITFSTPFRNLSYDRYPTFSDFDDQIVERMEEIKSDAALKKEADLLSDLHLKMTSILMEWSVFFNGTTSIKKNDSGIDMISFGTKILFNKPDNLKNALTYIMFQYAWSQCLDEEVQSAFIIDEAHTMILEPKTAENVGQFVRRSRKYGNITILSTQEPKDMAADHVLIHGKAMFNNSAYKIVMNLNLDAVTDLRKLMTLNDTEVALIQDFVRGEALLCAGNRRIPIKVIATENEILEMKGS